MTPRDPNAYYSVNLRILILGEAAGA